MTATLASQAPRVEIQGAMASIRKAWRPRYSLCPPGQQFVPGRSGRLTPIHTPHLADACKCGPCRGRRTWTPERAVARSAEYRARFAAEGAPKRRPPAVADRWLPDHDAMLRSLLGTMDMAGIAERLTERFGWPRTKTAVIVRSKVLGLSRLAVRPYACRELARLLGVADSTVERWIRDGLIAGTPWMLGGGHKAGHRSQVFSRAEVERFIRAHPDRVRVERVRDGGLRALVEGLTRGRRLLTLPEAARAAGVGEPRLRYLLTARRVPGAYQLDGRYWRIPAASVLAMRGGRP